MNTQSKATLRLIGSSILLLLFITSTVHPAILAQENDESSVSLEGVENVNEDMPQNEAIESMPGFDVKLVADPSVNEFFVPPPFDVSGERAVQAVAMTVVYNPASCDTDEYGATTPWPAEARAAFDYAMAIWGSVLNGARAIVIRACLHTGMDSDLLGSAGATGVYRNFPNAPRTNTWYQVALANQLSNSDINGDTAEIRAQFNANHSWYYGLDGRPSSSQHDFVTVVLHEIGHGLGFSGRMNVNLQTNSPCTGAIGTGCWSPSDNPPVSANVYDHHTTRQTSNPTTYTPILSNPNPSQALGTALTSGNVFWAGASGGAANGGTRPELYAPSTWESGSSYSHLDQGFNNTVNALMTFSLSRGEAIHHPGPVALGMLQDMGWSVNNRTEVYVNRSYSGVERGTLANPFITVQRGVHAVQTNGTVRITPGNYNQTMTLIRPMTLTVNGTGTVTIGQ